MKSSSKRTIKNIIIAMACLLLCLILVIGFAACGTEGAVGPQGEQGIQGPKGDPGEPGKDYTPPVEPIEPVDPITEGKVTATGVDSANLTAKGKYYADYATMEDTLQAGMKLNIQLAEEGNVLLKNENDALPLTKNERYVTLFGVSTHDHQTGGGGAGGGSPGSYGIPVTTITNSMKNAGFQVNSKVQDAYEKYLSLGNSAEMPTSNFTNSVIGGYGGYNDAAVITFSRTGSEDRDLAMKNAVGHDDPNEHYLQLSRGERDLIKHVKEFFAKVVVIINSSNIMEIPELAEQRTDDNLGVDAILWIGHTGNDGAAAIGSILSGAVNPSGHTVDIWMSDFTKDPTYTNFGSNTHITDKDGNNLDAYLYKEDGTATDYTSIEYREGIYLGYRYYETKAYDMNKSSDGSGDKWYEEEVLYPFGYGLSYTDFDWEIAADIPETAIISDPHSTVTMKVKVTNVGFVAGKDVVQVYYNPPYTEKGIEKSSANLAGFAKTKLLQPGQSQTVTVKFVAQDMASFDYNDKNNNDFYGYELEKGNYMISVCRNSHEVVDSVTRTINQTIFCDTDYVSGNKITPVFNGEGDLYEYVSTNDSLDANEISRVDLKQPAAASKEDRTVTQIYVDTLNSGIDYYSYNDQEDDVWYVSDVPASWDQAKGEAGADGKYALTLKDMAGIPFNEATIDENGVATAANDADSQKWETFMNQLTLDELHEIVGFGSYGQKAISTIDRDVQDDLDGASHFAWISGAKGVKSKGCGTNWVTAPVIAATFNLDLASEVGRIVGNESLFVNCTGWYGPSMNTHRSPFGGRNYEYYSQDGLHSGLFAAAITKSATEKGVVCYIKHMFLNEQETHRNSVATWVNEQAIREIYARPFEYAVKHGKAMGAMQSFNRIGDVMASVNYAMQEVLMRQEWGFNGVNLTDAWGRAYRPANLMIRTGEELPLGDARTQGVAGNLEKGEWNTTEKMVYVKGSASDTGNSLASPTHYYHMRKSAQRILYISANNNNNSNFVADTISLTVEVPKNMPSSNVPTVEIPVNTDDAGTDDVVVNKLKDGEILPDGLTINGSIISGIATDTTDTSVIVELLCDGLYTVEATLNIKFVDPVSYKGTAFDEFEIGSAIDGNFSSAFAFVGRKMGAGMGVYTAQSLTYSISSGELPTGVSLSPDGKLTGAPTTAGTFTFTVQLAEYATLDAYPPMYPQTFYYKTTCTIVIA